MQSLINRLKERKLVQWALAYLAGAWALLQVVDTLGDNFEWPRTIFRGATVLLGIGFLAALVLAWYHGEKGQQRVSGPELFILSALLVLAGGTVWFLGTSDADATGQSRPAAVAIAAPVERSIAVLPFVNMSSDPEQEYFSDGITEELLNALAQVEGLKVAARTSSFSFKGKNLPVDSVGRALKVAHVLEGSVRKSGDRLRITAQLINARDGYHLWSDTYDRELRDVFQVQDEISRAIVDALKVKLAKQNAPLVSAPTRSSQAHDLYLRGRHFWSKRTPQSLRAAEAYFRKALELDPTYARAYVGLADTYTVQGLYGGADPGVDPDRKAEAAARQALALDPSLAEAYATLGTVIAWDGDAAATEAAFLRAIELSPNYASAHQWYSYFLVGQGRDAEALAEIRKAYELDPLSLVMGRALGVILADVGHLQEAVAQLRRTIEVDPNNPVPQAYLALTLSRMGRHTEAVAEAQRARQLDPANLVVLQMYALVQARGGERAEAEAALREYEQRAASVTNFHVTKAQILVALERHDRAFQALELAVRERPGSIWMGTGRWLLEPLHSDSRWSEIRRRSGLD